MGKNLMLDELRASLADIERRIGLLEIARATAVRLNIWESASNTREMARLHGRAAGLRWTIRREEERNVARHV